MTLMAFIVALGIGCSYFLFLFFLQFFFKGTIEMWKVGWKDVFLALLIGSACVAITYLTLFVPDKELGNRILHTFAGGFLAFIACFFAAVRSSVSLSRFQFFSLAFLFVTALGVGNEIVEYFIDQTTTLKLAYTISDTWLDLLSNLIGILFASVSLVWFPSRIDKS